MNLNQLQLNHGDYRPYLLEKVATIRGNISAYRMNIELSASYNQSLNEIALKAENIASDTSGALNKDEELSILKKEYEAIIGAAERSKAKINTINVETGIAKVIIVVLRQKATEGTNIDLRNEIEPKFAHEVLLQIQEEAKRIQLDGSEQQKQTATEILNQIKIVSLENLRTNAGGIENLVYDEAMMKKFFSLTQNKTKNADKHGVGGEEEEVVEVEINEEDLFKEKTNMELFQEYRQAKIEYYSFLTRRTISVESGYVCKIYTDNSMEIVRLEDWDNNTDKIVSHTLISQHRKPVKALIFGDSYKFLVDLKYIGDTYTEEDLSNAHGDELILKKRANSIARHLEDIVLNSHLKRIGAEGSREAPLASTGVKELVIPPEVERTECRVDPKDLPCLRTFIPLNSDDNREENRKNLMRLILQEQAKLRKLKAEQARKAQQAREAEQAGTTSLKGIKKALNWFKAKRGER